MPKAGETTRTGDQGTVGLPLLMVVPKPSWCPFLETWWFRPKENRKFQQRGCPGV